MWKLAKMFVSAIIFATAVASAIAQQIETPPPPHGVPKARPYLPARSVNFHLLIPGPPAVGSAQDEIDQQAVMSLQESVSADRWRTAEEDAQYVFARFSDVLDRPLNRETSPFTVYLLNRALRDVVTPTFAAKDNFQRPRPYQRLQLLKICGEAAAPAPEVSPTQGSSYPSGHSAYGWITGLVLAQVVQQRAPQILQRASEYAQSRLICGVHFPSDIEAGKVLAVAVAERLKSNRVFRHDLLCAQREMLGLKRKSNCKLPEAFRPMDMTVPITTGH